MKQLVQSPAGWRIAAVDGHLGGREAEADQRPDLLCEPPIWTVAVGLQRGKVWGVEVGVLPH